MSNASTKSRPGAGEGPGPESQMGNEISDGQGVLEHPDGHQTTFEVEIDGAYYGRMLRDKVAGLARSGKPVLYVTTAGRAATIRQAIASHTNISLLVVVVV